MDYYLLAIGVVLLGMANPAESGARNYDRVLEAAAIRIVASRMGELRGSLEVDPRKPRKAVADRAPGKPGDLALRQTVGPARRNHGSFHYLD